MTLRLFTAWMSIAIVCAAAWTRAQLRVGWKQQRFWRDGLQIVDDCKRLGQGRAVLKKHGRNTLARVERGVPGFALLSGDQIDRAVIVAEAFEVQGDANPVRSR